MLNYFYQISDTKVFFIMIFIAIIFSVILIFLNKYFLFNKLKYRDNATTASIAALLGIIYGVLVGFICLYLLNNQDRAVNAAMDEGIAAANIYRDSQWLKEPAKKSIQSELKNYITTVLTIEWPEMNAGKVPDTANGYSINNMSSVLMHYPLNTQADNLIVTDLMQEIKQLFKGRQLRIEMSRTELSVDIWGVILLSTVLIIVINYAFRVRFYLHLFTITTFAIMAASILFLLVTLDRPFQGEFEVEPTALLAVQDIMKHDGL
jgi:undecaprenyl pyrophosphate phosphatase UppP